MLANTLYRVPRHSGLHLLQRRGDGGAHELTSWRLRLDAGETTRFVVDAEETIGVLQQGRGTFAVGDPLSPDALRRTSETWPVARNSVFTDRATAVYVPPGQTLTVTADNELEMVLVSTPAAGGARAALIKPDDVVVNARGRANFAREVHDIFVRDGYVERLMVGETFNPPGNWSSYPPHKHDG